MPLNMQQLQERVQQAKQLAAQVPSGDITRENHGPKGQQALYIGRGPMAHGLNIVHLTEPAYQWPAVFDLFAASPEHVRLITELWELVEKQQGLLAHFAYDLSFCPVCEVDYLTRELGGATPVHKADCQIAEVLSLPRETA